MLLPAQHGAAEHDAILLVGGLERGKPAPLGKIGECRAVGLRALAGSVKGEMQHAARRLDRRERPRMRLAEDGRAQRMREKPRAIAASDCDISTHALPVARSAGFDKHGDESVGRSQLNGFKLLGILATASCALSARSHHAD
jgi:hypothetical protein